MSTHPEKNMLLLFHYGELSDIERQAITEHLSDCMTCQKDLALLRQTQNIYQKLPLEVPPHEILSRLLAQRKSPVPVKTRLQLLFKLLFLRQPRRWAIASLCGILLVVSMVIFFGRPSKQPFLTGTPESAILLSQWRSPTDFLLNPPCGQCGQLLRTIPQLGESFTRIKAVLPDNADQIGGNDAT